MELYCVADFSVFRARIVSSKGGSESGRESALWYVYRVGPPQTSGFPFLAFSNLNLNLLHEFIGGFDRFTTTNGGNFRRMETIRQFSKTGLHRLHRSARFANKFGPDQVLKSDTLS